LKTRWAQFSNDPTTGPEDGLKWPEKPLGVSIGTKKGRFKDRHFFRSFSTESLDAPAMIIEPEVQINVV
jgi:hypothetical protein